MALAIQVLDLPTAVVIPDQIGRILISEDRQGLLELVLLNVAMSRKVATGAASRDKVSAG
jgi:hypothetical protein